MGSRPIADLNTLFDSFVHTNCTGLTADPSIRLSSEEPPTSYANGEVVLNDQIRGPNENFGSLRHKYYFVSGYTYYESTTDVIIMLIMDELERLMNVNNAAKNTYKFEFINERFNGNPIVGVIEWEVRAKEKWVSAIS